MVYLLYNIYLIFTFIFMNNHDECFYNVGIDDMVKSILANFSETNIAYSYINKKDGINFEGKIYYPNNNDDDLSDTVIIAQNTEKEIDIIRIIENCDTNNSCTKIINPLFYSLNINDDNPLFCKVYGYMTDKQVAMSKVSSLKSDLDIDDIYGQYILDTNPDAIFDIYPIDPFLDYNPII